MYVDDRRTRDAPEQVHTTPHPLRTHATSLRTSSQWNFRTEHPFTGSPTVTSLDTAEKGILGASKDSYLVKNTICMTNSREL
jgi:hypothetical protein